MKNYIYQEVTTGVYKVTRVDVKKPRGDKNRYKEYLVDLKKFSCDCRGFYFLKRPCKHMLYLIEEIKKGKSFPKESEVGNIDLLFKEVIKDEENQNNKKRHSRLPKE